MTTPLPKLRPADLGCSRVLHQVVDGHAPDAAQPALHVAEADVEVLADAFFGDFAGDVHVDEVRGLHVVLLVAVEDLVGRGHVLVEDVDGDFRQCWVRHPCAVMPGLDFAQLVRHDGRHGLVVGFLVVLDGDLRCHAAHGVDAALVAGLDQELDIGGHEGDGHCDCGTVGEDELGVLAEALDYAEDVVPAAAVEAGGVVAELVDDLRGVSRCEGGMVGGV